MITMTTDTAAMAGPGVPDLRQLVGMLASATPPGIRLRFEVEWIASPAAAGDAKVPVTEGDPEPSAAGSAGADLPSAVGSAARQPEDDDLAYLERLAQHAPQTALTTRRWREQLTTVSERQLRRAKQESLLSYGRRGETRGGNAHLIPVGEVLRLLRLRERVESGRLKTLPPGYAEVFGPTRR